MTTTRPESHNYMGLLPGRGPATTSQGRGLTHIDLFSGIGGFALAARLVGLKTIQFVEIDPFCQNVLRKNFPEVPIHDDIKTFTYAKGGGLDSLGRKVPEGWQRESGIQYRVIQQGVFLLTGGFPCQPFSCAGRRKGKDDDRHLWPEMLRVISEVRPTWILGENVGGIINMAQPGSEPEMEGETDTEAPEVEDIRADGTLWGIIEDLERIGYDVQPFIIPACAVGAPHRRDRVWICGRRNDVSDPEATELDGCRPSRGWGDGLADTDSHAPSPSSDGLHTQEQGELRADTDAAQAGTGDAPEVGRPGLFHRGQDASDTRDEGLQGSEWTGTYEGRREVAHGTVAERNNAWDEPWLEVATRLCRVDDGVSTGVDRTQRLKALGNAIVPQVAYQIIKAILASEFLPRPEETKQTGQRSVVEGDL